jgi:hypothetical protein
MLLNDPDVLRPIPEAALPCARLACSPAELRRMQSGIQVQR